ncbi:N-acetylserotonin O-methyltransferase-like protein [Hypsizygus marmoreus]|uniref:N-acetylserotonin O-methyltransferase-like protein n=1 Tax=Hypsizygus marmoreus TaxID=39966 RepID=A0A369JUT0_HYPMA|nr:N-acetylserotonin O-methyltransferase-like protein [Hypsizygus marmoreus]
MSKHILPHALQVPAIKKLAGKRIVLASNSPRRQEILHTFGLAPDVVPSTFEEDLAPSAFDDIHEYPVATAMHKAVEVYERLVRDDPDNPPDLVIAADTVVLTHAQPSTSDTSYSILPGMNQELLEKPISKEDNFRMLLDLNGGLCEVVTGVTIVYPVLTAPGYTIKSIDERTLVHFSDNPRHIVKAYVDSGEGMDRAGGFAVQGLGGLLVRKIEGDYQNVVGFPAASFFAFLDLLLDEDPDFLDL